MPEPPTRERLEYILSQANLLKAYLNLAIDLINEEDTPEIDSQLAAAEKTLEIVASEFAELRLKHT